jgi:magnesium-transporting ATPase (P-type)
VSSQQEAVLRVVRNLAAFNGVVIAMLVGYTHFLGLPLAEIIPLVLTAVLASIPVALPATFTLASALGARALAKQGVLPTRLSAVDEAATMDVLCADKTGTLTRNLLTVTTVRSMPGFEEAHILALAALASSDGGQDPVEEAIRTAARGKDAPALRQAQIGIAVSTATDVAKSAAGMVLTEPGLVGIVAAVKEGRIIFQRILTYTLNSIIKKIVTVLFLVLGLIMTGHAILTPLLMVIVMVAGDFLAMSLTTDNVQPSPMPNAWRIGNLTIAGVIMGVCLLAFCTVSWPSANLS